LDILRYIYRDLQLVIVGQGSDIPRLREFARSIRVEAAVHFLGPRTEVAALMHAAEMVWVPTLTSGGSLVALEAMAAGRPVVASAVGELPEIVVDGATGFLVPPSDPVALARRTRHLLDEESLRRAQGAAGRERIRQGFTDAHLVRRFAEVYNAPRPRSLQAAA
jgi:glycosyltransferase involved in cell wall biosynthesis